MGLPLIDCVTLTQVPESQRQIITNLIQLYKYDFSEFAEVGSRAARVLFERWPGRWEVSVARYNKPALSFWRKAIRASIEGTVEEYTGDFERQVGTVLCFDSCPHKP